MALLLLPALCSADSAAVIVAELIGEESGDSSSGDVATGIAAGLDRERGGVWRASNMVSCLESRVARESADETEVCLALKPDLSGRDGPFEKAELVGVRGRTGRLISRGLVD